MNAMAKSMLAGICALLGANVLAATPENTPDRFLRYVEATGSQYVDTGVTGRYGTKAECKMEWTAFSDSAFLACGDWSAQTRFFPCYCSSANGNMFAGYGAGAKIVHNGLELLFEKKRVYTFVSDYSAIDGDGNSVNTVTIDGTKVLEKTSKGIDTGRTLYVFACNQKANTVIGKSSSRCYGLKIWQDGSLVRDFRPCLKGERAGLYDTKTETIFYSASGTDLVYDADSDVPDAFIEYVESCGNSYIDTGIVGKSGTSAKMEMAWVGASSDQALLESRNGNSRFYLVHNGGNNKWLYGYGNYTTFGSFESGTKYYVESSLSANAQTIKIGTNGIDGATTKLVDAHDTATIDTGLSMYLFCCNKTGGALAQQYWGKARVYWLQIFQNGTKVRDFRPCLKYGVAALYDAVSHTIFYPEGDPLAFDNSVAEDADNLVFVDYIESDGSTYIDTQVSAQSPTRAAGAFSWSQLRTSSEENAYLGPSHRSYLACGCYNSSSDANRFYMIDETSQNFWIGYGNSAQAFSAATEGRKYDFDVTFSAGSQTLEVTPENGSLLSWSTTVAGEADGRGNLYLFACNDAKNGKPIYQSAARCYGLTIWQNGSKVREFKPCVKDGQAMLYDTVSHRVFLPTPAIPADGHTGAVAEESQNSPLDTFLEYVETDGTQYIDTGVPAKAGTKAEFVETCLKTQDGEQCLLGACRANSERFFMWMYGNIWTLGLGFGGSYWRPSLSDPNTPAAQWGEGYQDVYRMRNGDKTHAKVTFSPISQTVEKLGGSWSTVSAREIVENVDTGLNLYLFGANIDEAPDKLSKTRLEWMKIWQDGVRKRHFRPARLKNGLVVMWDLENDKPYFLKSPSNPGIVRFSAVGPDSSYRRPGLLLIFR